MFCGLNTLTITWWFMLCGWNTLLNHMMVHVLQLEHFTQSHHGSCSVVGTLYSFTWWFMFCCLNILLNHMMVHVVWLEHFTQSQDALYSAVWTLYSNHMMVCVLQLGHFTQSQDVSCSVVGTLYSITWWFMFSSLNTFLNHMMVHVL